MSILPGPLYTYTVGLLVKIVDFVINILISVLEWIKHLVS